MRIGIDLDDTVCKTTEMFQEALSKYAEEKKVDALDIMNDYKLKSDFYKTKLLEIYKNAAAKKEAARVLRRLKSKGNELYFITARGNYLSQSRREIEEITKAWLKEHQIEADKIFFNSYGEDKALVCKNNKIDLMIDDDPYNYKIIVSAGLKCLLFDDHEKYDLEKDYVTNWIEIEKYIERNH